jgi:hypothetical protein
MSILTTDPALVLSRRTPARRPMNRQQLAHLLRAACQISGDPRVVVMGSQSILGTYDEDDLPPEATASIEADIAFLDDPDHEKADRVEGVIGELSLFHEEYGVYADGFRVQTAILPEGWQDRLVGWPLKSSEPSEPVFLDPHDVAIAKLAAYRDKDRAFVDALLRARMLDAATLRERVDMLPDDVDPRYTPRIHRWLDSYDKGAERARTTNDRNDSQ